jgi:hypothetical protein
MFEMNLRCSNILPNIWEDIKGDWMLLLKVTDESMKKVGLKNYLKSWGIFQGTS